MQQLEFDDVADFRGCQLLKLSRAHELIAVIDPLVFIHEYRNVYKKRQSQIVNFVTTASIHYGFI